MSRGIVTDILSTLNQSIRREFDANRSLLSFDEYLALVGENPTSQLRGSARYVLDLLEHFGRSPTEGDTFMDREPGSNLTRFRVFDGSDDGTTPRIVGHERVQGKIHAGLQSFAQQGINNRLLLLHGPNGSAKSSIVQALMMGMERYSRTKEGAAYTFNWIFPTEKSTRAGMGLAAGSTKRASDSDRQESFARLSDEEINARIPCDLKDHPLLLVPKTHRKELLTQLIGDESSADRVWKSLPLYLSHGEPCHRCKEIFDTLLGLNGGDYRKVLRHIQVERFYYSRQFRRGLVTIEPQLHVDAHAQQLTANRGLSSLPSALQALSLFSVSGDLVEGNRGLIEFSDLLKRPLDSFKYLLGLCETGRVNIGSSIAVLDTVLIGSVNEVQLDAFKEIPDFTSFRARLELIRVPYLRSVSREREIYESQIYQFGGIKHVAPHVAWTAALWAVLTRLKKPNSVNFPPNVGSLIASLTPLEKARIYDSGELPSALPPEDRKLLRANLQRLADEYNTVPYYEGRLGASVREMRSLLFEAAQNNDFPCLSPLSLLRQIEAFTKRTSEYEFLNQEIKDGFHDAQDFIAVTRNEYLSVIDREVRDALGLYETTQWEEFIKRYVQQVSLVVKKEKSKNPITGKTEDPDFSLINEFEKIVEAPVEAPEALDTFRTGLISQVGAWVLDHPKQPVVYGKVFPELWKRLEQHYYESQKALIQKMGDAIPVLDTEKDDPTSEGGKLARQTLQTLESKRGYCRNCAKEVVSFLLKQRY